MPFQKEIAQLLKLRDTFKIKVERREVAAEKAASGLIPVRFYLDKNHWDLLLEDEYKHFNEKHPLLCIYLVLSSLEDYQESTDFLAWCRELGLDASNNTLQNYYRDLSTMHAEIVSVLGKIDPIVSSYDYTMGTGVVEALKATPLSL